jgi:hypothetical protein
MRTLTIRTRLPLPYMRPVDALRQALLCRSSKSYRDYGSPLLWVRIWLSIMFECRYPREYALWLEREVYGWPYEKIGNGRRQCERDARSCPNGANLA